MPWNDRFNSALGGASGALAGMPFDARLGQILAAAAFGSSKGLGQYDEEMERRRIAEERLRLEEERVRVAEERERRQQEIEDRREAAERDKIEGLREQDAFAREQNDPYLVGPRRNAPSPGAFEPGEEAKYWEGRSEDEAKSTARAASHTQDLDLIRKAGKTPTGIPEWDHEIAKEIVKGMAGGGDEGLSPSEALARERFEYEKEQKDLERRDRIDGGVDARHNQSLEEWEKKRQSLVALAARQAGDESSAEEIAKLTDELTTSLYGPAPTRPPQAAPKTRNVRQPKPLPAFAGSFPTKDSPAASPTGPTAPPAPAKNPMGDRLNEIDAVLREIQMPPQVAQQAKAAMLEFTTGRGYEDPPGSGRFRKLTVAEAAALIRESQQRLGVRF